MDLLAPVYRAIEMCDADALRRRLRDDVFMFTPEAAGVLVSADEVVDRATRDFGWLRSNGVTLRVRPTSSLVGTTPSEESAWVFDRLDVEMDAASLHVEAEVRVTALLVLDGEDTWRVAAAYWSLPYETQAEQDALKEAGDLEPGAVLVEALTGAAWPLATVLAAALEQPTLLPGLYSTRDDHVTIGSVTDEVFVGPAGRAAWEEFVQAVDAFALRGPMRGGLVSDDIGWLAANVDILVPPTPYRFFYIWLRESGTWKIVVSHDAVSRPLAPPS